MNAKQARRLSRLFTEATPPKPMYWEEGEPIPSVHISVRYEDDALELRMLCPETTLVRFNDRLYINPEGVLCEYDSELDRLVPVSLTWDYRAERYTWTMVAKPAEAVAG